MLMPALFTRMSRRPNAATVSSTIRATSAALVTSTATARALAPRSISSRTAASDFLALRAATTTAAPAAARPRAMPSPMPPLPPVTTATLPLRSNTSPSPVFGGRIAGVYRIVESAPDGAGLAPLRGSLPMYVANAKRLTHQGARLMADTAIAMARDAGIAISVAIADAGGHLLVLERMDGGR